jgi:hypothetical protein
MAAKRSKKKLILMILIPVILLGAVGAILVSKKKE